MNETTTLPEDWHAAAVDATWRPYREVLVRALEVEQGELRLAQQLGVSADDVSVEVREFPDDPQYLKYRIYLRVRRDDLHFLVSAARYVGWVCPLFYEVRGRNIEGMFFNVPKSTFWEAPHREENRMVATAVAPRTAWIQAVLDVVDGKVTTREDFVRAVGGTFL